MLFFFYVLCLVYSKRVVRPHESRIMIRSYQQDRIFIGEVACILHTFCLLRPGRHFGCTEHREIGEEFGWANGLVQAEAVNGMIYGGLKVPGLDQVCFRPAKAIPCLLVITLPISK